jgi:hypothetical protein
VIAIVAVLGTLGWVLVDRRRTSYPRLLAYLRVALRYVVAYAMFSYGLAKILKQQFPGRPGRRCRCGERAA